ncbi:MAG: hypothetical protein ACK4TP_10140 [Hyphomicrobium sp.]
MALDKPIVTEKLPDLWTDEPGPLPDAADEMSYYIDRLADAISAYIGTAMHVTWWESFFTAIGLFATGVTLYALAMIWWEGRREHMRRDELAVALAKACWDELSPADLLYVEENWPREFALARYLDECSPRRLPARAQERRDSVDAEKKWLDAWFDAQRDAARSA